MKYGTGEVGLCIVGGFGTLIEQRWVFVLAGMVP